ncbi:MAG TPA: ABC transporter substrate-binding protein, partial [Bacillota bacterium]|nr:ABC transporter substrate-binding protein [Bacillota bacterium]
MIKRFSVVIAMLLIVLALIASSCAPKAGEEGGEEARSGKYGGIVRSAYTAPSTLDPAFQSGRGDSHIAWQWNDSLVYIDEENEPDISRSVAEHWEADETGTVWTFKIRQGIKFHDGKDMTARDVKFSFDRLRDPEVGAPTVELYANIKEITTPDDYTVVFKLENPNPDFLKDLGDYHAKIMDADNTDFATNWNGTGPFMIESYSPEDRIVFKRNPHYWMTDDEGNQLPYLDGMEFIFLDDPSAQIEALRGGQVDYLIYLPPEYVPLLKEDPNITIYSKPSNGTFVIRMRSDRPPANDVRVRQALKLVPSIIFRKFIYPPGRH